jgi:DNA-binding transcriptional LysR family regulator
MLNMSKAARVLEIDQTTVYRRILRLEKKIGKKLLKKTAQGYILTAWGEGLARKSARLNDEIKEIDQFIDGQLSDIFGTVKITTTNVIANVVLPPLLSRLHKKYSQLKIELIVDEDFFDIYKRDADIAIRSSDVVQPPEYAINVGKGAWAFYAVKDYIKNKPGTNSQNFYSNNLFIIGTERISNIKSTKYLRTIIDEDNIALKANSMESIYAAVKAGLGIGLLPSIYKTMDNSLVELSKPDPKFGAPIWIITQKELIDTEKIQICIDYFYKELKKVFCY